MANAPLDSMEWAPASAPAYALAPVDELYSSPVLLNDSSMWASPPPPPSSSGYSLGNSENLLLTCANSSSPICYSTAISGQNIVTGIYVNLILGFLCYLGFVICRGLKGFEFYEARLHLPQVSRKPPELKLHGHYRFWSWLIPVLKVTDEQLVQSAGLDALIAVRILAFGVMLFIPFTIGGMVLLAINYTDTYYLQQAETLSVDATSSAFMRMSISNITQNSPRLWVHFCFVYLFIAYTCWLIVEYYKEFVALRQTYMVKITELSMDASAPGTPSLLAPTPPRRSPMKKTAMLAKQSPQKRGSGTGTQRGGGHGAGQANGTTTPSKLALLAAGGGGGSGQSSGAATPARRNSLLRLPRRHASRGREEEFESEQSKPGFSFHTKPSALGSGTAAQGDVAGLGQVFGLPTPPSRHSSNASLLPHSARGHKPGSLALRSDAAGYTDSPAGPQAPTPRLSQPAADASASEPAAATAAAAAAEGAREAGTLGHASSGGSLSLSLKGSGQAVPEAAPQPAAEVAEARPESPAAAAGAAAAAAAAQRGSPPSAAAAPLPDGLPPGRPLHTPSSSLDAAAAAALSAVSQRTLEEVYAAIAVQAHSSSSYGGEIPAVGVRRTDDMLKHGDSSGHLQGHFSAPLAFEMDAGLRAAAAAECAAGEPISKWWLHQKSATGGPPSTRFAASQSITFRAAVPLAQQAAQQRQRACMAANASLYTVLVLDMPVERLKLRRMGVLPGRMGHLMRLSGAEGSQQDERELATSATMSPDEMEQALDDLEEGQAGSSKQRSGAAQLYGVSAVTGMVKGIWRHCHRFGDWRRDVKWSMYNKRVRVATEMFTELFGSEFDSIVPIYDARSVDKLLSQWEKKQAALERAQVALQDALDAADAGPSRCALLLPSSSCCSGGKGKASLMSRQERRIEKQRKRIAGLQREICELQEKVAEQRDMVLSDLPSTCFFATFRSQQAAAIASQTNLNPIVQRLFKVEPAPRPEDVNWPTLQRSWWERTARPFLALPMVALVILLPVGAFTGAFAQLTLALCGNPLDPSSTGTRTESWYCSDDTFATFFRNFVTAIVPALLLSIYHMVLLPVLVYYAAQMAGEDASLSALDRRCASLFWWFDVINIFLGAMLGGTVLSGIKGYLEDPSSIWNSLGAAIPSSSNFFVNYVIYRCLVMSAFRLLYPHQRIMTATFQALRILPRARTPRDKAMENPPRNCRYGRDIGIPVLMNFVMCMAYCIISPIILPFGLLYFLGLWLVWRYQMLYVYQRQYESGGQFWPFVAHKIVGCLSIMSVFTGIVFLFKAAYTQAAILFITAPIILLRFDGYITRVFDDLVAQTPLMAVHKAGRGRVDPEVYTSPPLRPGCAGWTPEYGKVWAFWGIPRYTL